MKITIDYDAKVTAEEMVEELCFNFDEVEQANFLYELARRYKFHKSEFLEQLQLVGDEVNCKDDCYGKTPIVHMLEEILDYVKGDEES